jgi:hypothetical protein
VRHTASTQAQRKAVRILFLEEVPIPCFMLSSFTGEHRHLGFRALAVFILHTWQPGLTPENNPCKTQLLKSVQGHAAQRSNFQL